MAAVLACGAGAYLSHRCCCEHWELVPAAPGTPLEVTLLGRRPKGPRGVRVHRAEEVAEDELTVLRGVPVTSAARAVIDLAATADRYTVAKAYEEGLIQGFYDRDEMARLVDRHAGRRGIKKVRFLVERDAPPSWTIGEAHKRLLELVRSAGLPHPETEVQIGPYRVDMLWRRERVIVEVDGATYHSLPSRIEADKRRDAELAARGYIVIRVTGGSSSTSRTPCSRGSRACSRSAPPPDPRLQPLVGSTVEKSTSRMRPARLRHSVGSTVERLMSRLGAPAPT